MCGILGIINFNNNPVNPNIISSASELLKRRGPDDCGVWAEENIGLGHRRLSVLDTSDAGHQPMLSHDKRYVIVFNGEIYNFQEVREKINSDKNNWYGNSDTEVILEAYIKYGVDCLKLFHGMFAFTIWDRKEKVLFAARDRIGVKPFYYHYSSNCFAFSSRPKVLFSLNPKINNEIDNQALRLYLECGYVPAPYSIFQEIKKLLPSHYLLINKNGLQIKKYYDFCHIESDLAWLKRKEEDLLDELDAIISCSVKSRMISDVPLGAFLSGGIDSSLVVALMSKYSSQPIKTFTIGFNEKKYDESPHAKAVANHLKTEHYAEFLSIDNLLDLMPTFLEEYDEPFYDSSSFPSMALSRLTRKHVTVSLSGDGGDELFGGYHYYQIVKTLEPLFKLSPNLRKYIGLAVKKIPKQQFQFLGSALQKKDIISTFAFIRSISKDFEEILYPEIISKTDSIYTLFNNAAETFPKGLSSAEKGMRLDFLYTLPDDYMQKVDVASMAFSLESREPLLDHSIIEWSMKLPLKWKLQNGTNKYILRKLAYRYVPQNILDRPKQGFVVPIDQWLRGPLKDWAEEHFNDKSLFENIPIKQSSVINLWNLHKNRKRNVHPLLWAILIFLNFKRILSKGR